MHLTIPNMPVISTAEAIVFAIHSAIKLGRNIQKAYANSLRARSIVLPLPDFKGEPDSLNAQRFFEDEGAFALLEIEELDQLHKINKERALSPEEEERYVEYFVTLDRMRWADQSNKPVPEASISLDDVLSLLRVRQWTRGQSPQHSPLQLVAGTLVEIGIDYFTQVPGALNLDSTQGKLIHHFLDALDQVEIAEADELTLSLANEVLPRLFIAAAESAVRFSAEISKDEKLQLFVEASGKGVADELLKRMQQADSLNEKEALLYWGESLVRALFFNAGHYAFSSPGKVFNTSEEASALIEATGLALMDVLFDEESTRIDLKALITVESLDLLVRRALEVVAQNPQLLTSRAGLKEIIVGLSQAVAESGIQQAGILPELAQLVLQLTAENLDRLWKADDQPEHLLVTAVAFSLRTLAEPPASGGWKPHFPPSQLLALAELLLEEVVAQPEWILHELDGKPILEEALQAVFHALEEIPPEQRLSLDAVQTILENALLAVAASDGLLVRLQWGEDEEERTILQEALRLVFAFTFRKKEISAPDRQAQFFELLDYVLSVVLRQQPNRSGVELTRLLLQAFSPFEWHQGLRTEHIRLASEAALEVLAEHPELVSGEPFVHQMLGGIADGLLQAGIDSPDLLSEIIRLILDHSAQHIDLVLHPAPEGSGNPFAEAVSQALQVLASAEVVGGFVILSRSQVLELLDILLAQVGANPQWLDGNALLQRLITAVLDALQNIPPSKPITNELVIGLVQLSIDHALADMRLLQPLDGEPAGSSPVLAYALGKLIQLLYDPKWPANLQWGLYQPEQLAGLCNLFLEELQELEMTTEALDALIASFWAALSEFGPAQTFNLDDFLRYLEQDMA